MPEPIAFVLDSLDSVEESLKPYYSEAEDGKFHLQGDESTLGEYSLVSPLVRAKDHIKGDLAKVKSERDKLKALTEQFPEDFDREKWDKLKDGKPDEAALIKLRQTLEGERDEWKTKYESQVENARKTAVQRDLTQELAANGVIEPVFQEAARMMLSQKVQMTEAGDLSIDVGLAPMPLSEGVKRWLASEGKRFVEQPKGGGSKGSDGSNAGGKTISAADLEKMTPREKAAYFKANPDVTVE